MSLNHEAVIVMLQGYNTPQKIDDFMLNKIHFAGPLVAHFDSAQNVLTLRERLNMFGMKIQLYRSVFFENEWFQTVDPQLLVKSLNSVIDIEVRYV